MIFWRGDSSRKNLEEAGNRKTQERMSGARSDSPPRGRFAQFRPSLNHLPGLVCPRRMWGQPWDGPTG